MSIPFSTELFQRLPVVGILRGLPAEKLPPLMAAVRDGGLTNLEITMNTPGAADQIRTACALAGGALNIGAGTVTNLQLLEEALAAGASFIVTPTVFASVMQRCVQRHVPVMPGAFSPTEFVLAWELGATLVKLFPAETLGPDFVRRIKTALPHVRLMPTGGVDVTTLAAYAAAGAEGFGIGSPLFRSERIAAQDWDWVREQTRSLSHAYHNTQELL